MNVGIVGPGGIAERHANALTEAGARIAAVAGPDRAQTTAFARAVRDHAERAGGRGEGASGDGGPSRGGYGEAAVYTSADDLYAHPGLDAVVIASPHAFHAAQTIAALRAGLHVLCEIPVALTLRDAEQIAQVAAQTGRHAAAAHTLRFCEPYRKVRDLVEAGDLDVRHIVARTLMLRQDDTGMEGRRRDWTDDVLWHHGAHTVDAALWLLDATHADVVGALGPVWPGSGRSMDVGAVVRAPDGDLATIALSYHARLPARELTIIAEDRTLHLSGGVLRDGDRILTDCGDRMEIDGMARQNRDFLTAVTQGGRPACTVDDVLPAMRILDRLANTGADTG